MKLSEIRLQDYHCIYAQSAFPVCTSLYMNDILSSAIHSGANYLLLQLGNDEIHLGPNDLLRMCHVLADVDASFLYSHYYRLSDLAAREVCEVNDYQLGSVRDNFDFGPLLLIKIEALANVDLSQFQSVEYAGWYQLRLALTEIAMPFRLHEVLYGVSTSEVLQSSQFDYVKPSNAAVQKEYELVFTSHLERIGAKLSCQQLKKPFDIDTENQIMMSVVIPVFNRCLTIEDAVRSAMSQHSKFPYNVIVVDNHSTDGTSDILKKMVNEYNSTSEHQLIHIVPQRLDLGIGGCWNEAIASPLCGKYVVQLDSDDIYSDDQVLNKIFNAFEANQCAAVVGSYVLTDFDKNTIAPGLIDHKEWTAQNGFNNALRINGLGAPRAFRRDVLREFPLPNTSYGEDYATMLRICREYKIGRIFEPLYYCRRWDGNSDAKLSRSQTNRNDYYKDQIRTIEITARIQLNREKNSNREKNL